MTPARRVAAKAIARTAQGGAFAAAALDAEIRRAKLDERDAALATELVYGVLRTCRYLEARANELARRGKLPDHPEAHAHILMALYSIAFLDRVPRHAAVSEAVEGVREAAGKPPAAFANALLRAFGRAIDDTGRPDLGEAARASLPPWLGPALSRALGEEDAARYLAPSAHPPPVGIAVARPEERGAWLGRIAASAPRAEIRPSSLSAHGILISGAGDPAALPGFDEDWIVQEEGAQIVTLALGACPNERVLDACAGRGNKSWLLAKRMGSAARLVAADRHPSKLDHLARRVPGAAVHAVDWTAGVGDVPDGMDRALVDAPCSGVGTLRRRPDVGWRRAEVDLRALADRQVAICRAAATRVRDGGMLLYAVCSVLREEGEDVVAALTREPGAVILEPAPLAIGGFDRPETSARLLPHIHGTDGYFLAGFRVRRPRQSGA